MNSKSFMKGITNIKLGQVFRLGIGKYFHKSKQENIGS
jgi:hypothetical protein